MCDCGTNIFNNMEVTPYSEQKVIVYDYLKTTVVDLSTIATGTSYSADTQLGCTLVGSILTYVPPIRQKEQLVYPFTVDGRMCLLVLVPDLEVNYTQNNFMAITDTGDLYRINALAKTETSMGINIPNILCATMNRDDNLLYYVLTTDLRKVASYSFTTGVTNLTFISGLTSDVRSINYDNNTLYTIQEADTTTITAYDVRYPTTYGVIKNLPQPYTLAAAIRQAFVSYSNVFYFGVRNAATASVVLQTLPFGSVTALATSSTFGNNNTLCMTQTPTGRLYVFDTNGKRFWSSRSMTTFSIEWTSTRNFVALTMLPYGL